MITNKKTIIVAKTQKSNCCPKPIIIRQALNLLPIDSGAAPATNHWLWDTGGVVLWDSNNKMTKD